MVATLGVCAALAAAAVSPSPTWANTRPQATDSVVKMRLGDFDYVFQEGDFNFSDADGDALAHVMLYSVPLRGKLTDRNGTELRAYDTVNPASGGLRFTPWSRDGHGEYYTYFWFEVNDGTANSRGPHRMVIHVQPMTTPTAGRPLLTGPATPRVGNTLTADTTQISGDVLEPSYLWWRCQDYKCDRINRTTSNTYTLTSEDRHHQIGVVVSFHRFVLLGEQGLTTSQTAPQRVNMVTGFSPLYPPNTQGVASRSGSLQPTAMSSTAPPAGETLYERDAYTFKYRDFKFDDISLASRVTVKIESLPARGSLTLFGKAVSPGDEVRGIEFGAEEYPELRIGGLKYHAFDIFHPDPDPNNPHTETESFNFKLTLHGEESPSAATMTITVTDTGDGPSTSDSTSGRTDSTDTDSTGTDGKTDGTGGGGSGTGGKTEGTGSGGSGTGGRTEGTGGGGSGTGGRTVGTGGGGSGTGGGSRRSAPEPGSDPDPEPVGFLENPGPHSFQSGIGLISGWVCEAETVEIEIDGARQPAAYGTERLDTLAECGDTDNGFGLLFNWNLLGDGEHEVVTWVDDVALGGATVTVTTLGEEFVREVAGECTVPDFPMVGETATLVWQEAQQNFVLAAGTAPAAVPRSGTAGVGYLENPSPNSFQSGLGVISGWGCEATEVVIMLGDMAVQEAAYGTERLDTLAACGDTDNGFGLLFNWNLLGDGEHTVVVLVDDTELGRATVRVTTLGEEFVEEAAGECELEDFPGPGETVTLTWQTAQQNFVITAVE